MSNSNKSTAAGHLRAFLDQLTRTYQARTSTTPAAADLRLSLTLAITGLDDWLAGQGRLRPLQIAVIGPTQVGKSTVVNLLLGAEQAVASPLAAYTRQLFGFTKLPALSAYNWIEDVLGRGDITLESGKQSVSIDSVIWDTPDFDSHRSHGYRQLIAKVAALADVYVLVVSKEKYADLTVWDTLAMIKPLCRHLVICLNKTSSDQQILVQAVRNRLLESGWEGTDVPVFTLPYIAQENVFEAMSQSEQVHALRARVFDPDNHCDEACRLYGMQRVVSEKWEGWIQPVKDEISAVDRWGVEVNRCLQDAMTDYRAQYLDHTHHADAFKQAMLRLLELLEIPGLGEPLSKIRRVLTWPVRKIFGAWQSQTGSGTKGTSEDMILSDIVDHALLSLPMTISQKVSEQGRAGCWWAKLSQAYHVEADNIRRQLPGAVNDYQEEFDPEIGKAAQSIYIHLQENPLVLNTLRATRLSADIAGIAVAVKTGAIGVSEALLTPAMLSVTSTLTESAVGTYVGSIRNQLKEKQYTLVEQLLNEQFTLPLLELRLDQPGLFNINERRLARAEVAKKELLA